MPSPSSRQEYVILVHMKEIMYLLTSKSRGTGPDLMCGREDKEIGRKKRNYNEVLGREGKWTVHS